MNDVMKLDQEYVANTYRRFPVEIVSGKGSLVRDRAGKEYIDLGSGIGVNCFGIADDGWFCAVTEQLSRLQHMSNLYYTEPCARLAEFLCRRTGMKKVFFSNSGAEANECAVKVARKYAFERHGADCYRIITLKNSFHGRTLTTLAATGQEHFHSLFQPLTEGFLHTPANDLAALEALVEEYPVAGILMECVQGEGGVIGLDAEFVRGAAALAAKKDILLMIDEVQTGNGRTGTLYSYMQFGISPDVVSTAKGLGGGLPLGATLLSERAESVLGFGEHGSTYGGNPVACAGALHLLERMDEAFLADVRRKSDMAFELLGAAKGVRSVSGMGLMIGIEPETKTSSQIVDECLKRGVLCLTAKQKVRLLPALNIPEDVLEKALKILCEVLGE